VIHRRTEAQLALLVIGVVVWGYGQRTDDNRLTWIGLAFFAGATVLRFLKRKATTDTPDDPPSP
jgi:hypothetical protein